MALRFARPAPPGAAALLVVTACGTPSAPGDDGGETLEITCSIPTSEIFRGALRDAIPALTDPALVRPETPGAVLWSDDDRVVGVVVGGEAVAVPLNIFWWHEVVNLEVGGRSVALTHCPLTGSSLAFDRGPVGGAGFGVSGLLYRNNLLMYDRTGGTESLWPQMARGARCGPRSGTPLEMVPVVEMTYGGWTRLEPATLVVSSDTGYERDYLTYPYFEYASENNSQLLYPIEGSIDRRRPPKERVLGIPDGDGGVAFPFGMLAERGDVVAIEDDEIVGGPAVVFWDADVRAAMAFRPFGPDGERLTFRVEGDFIVDVETGSQWSVTGRSSGGPLVGSVLEPVAEAYVAYWFAWPLFQPDIELTEALS